MDLHCTYMACLLHSLFALMHLICIPTWCAANLRTYHVHTKLSGFKLMNFLSQVHMYVALILVIMYINEANVSSSLIVCLKTEYIMKLMHITG